MKKKLITLSVSLCLMFCFALGLTGCDFEKNVVDIDLDTSNAKTIYYVGDEFSSEGLIVSKVYEDFSKAMIDEGFEVDSSEFDNSATGVYTITVNFDEFSKSYTVYVSAKSVGYEIDTTNVKTVYALGEEFSSEGLRVFKVFNDGSKIEVFDFSVDTTSFDKTAACEQTISVSVGGSVVQTYEVNVFSDSDLTSLLNLAYDYEIYDFRENGSAIGGYSYQLFINEDSFLSLTYAPDSHFISSVDKNNKSTLIDAGYLSDSYTYTTAENPDFLTALKNADFASFDDEEEQEPEEGEEPSPADELFKDENNFTSAKKMANTYYKVYNIRFATIPLNCLSPYSLNNNQIVYELELAETGAETGDQHHTIIKLKFTINDDGVLLNSMSSTEFDENGHWCSMFSIEFNTNFEMPTINL